MCRFKQRRRGASLNDGRLRRSSRSRPRIFPAGQRTGVYEKTLFPNEASNCQFGGSLPQWRASSLIGHVKKDWVATCRRNGLPKHWRTNDAELLEAARALRLGTEVRRDGSRFKVMPTPGKPNLAATVLANAIAWRDGGTLAVLTPSRRGGFVDEIVSLVRSRPLGRRKNGPFPIHWESSDETDHRELCRRLQLPERCSVSDAIASLEANISLAAVKSAAEWIARQRRVLGVQEITANQVHRQLERSLAARRRYSVARREELVAMTIQRAKNQQFAHVVVIWPYTIPKDNEQKRRLLYSAITRAERSCLVLVQGKKLLEMPPFVP